MKVARPVLNGGDDETCPKGKCALSLPNPWSDGTTGIRLSPVELLEKLAALVPLPRVHLVRYGGCLAPHSHLRGTIIPTPRQQGVEDEATNTGTSSWSWARLLKRVFALDMARCPFCQQGSLRIIAAITQGEVIRKILRHLKLAADPPRSHRRVSARKPSPGPPPDRAWDVADPSRVAGSWVPHSLCLVLGLWSPLTPPMGGEG